MNFYTGLNAFKNFEALFLKLSNPLVNHINEEDQSSVNYKRSLNRLWYLPTHLYHYYFKPQDKSGIYQFEKNKKEWVNSLRDKSFDLLRDTEIRKQDQQYLAQQMKSTIELFSFYPWALENKQSYLSLIDNPLLWQYLPEDYPNPVTGELADTLIHHSNANPQHHEVRAIHYKENIIGQVRLQFSTHDESSAEISYWIGQDYWGQGLASQFVLLYTFLCFIRYKKIRRIFAVVHCQNKGSVKVLERSGYRFETVDLDAIKDDKIKHYRQTLSIFRNEYHYLLDVKKLFQTPDVNTLEMDSA